MAIPSATLELRHLPDGYRRFGEVRGVDAGEFFGSADQIAIRYRRRGSQWGIGSEITVAWEPQGELALVGTSDQHGVPVRVGRHVGQYHDGYWMPGPGRDQIALPGGGSAHWGTGLVHSVTVRTDSGVVALRCPYQDVPSLSALLKIALSAPALA